MKKILQFIVLALMITSCGQNNRDQRVSDMAGSQGEMAQTEKESQIATTRTSSNDIIETTEVNKKNHQGWPVGH